MAMSTDNWFSARFAAAFGTLLGAVALAGCVEIPQGAGAAGRPGRQAPTEPGSPAAPGANPAGPGGESGAPSRGDAPEAEALRIDTIAPTQGSVDGGDLVHIEGAGFTPDTVVLFGGVAGLTPYEEAGERILVQTPPHAPGLVDVVVRRGDGAQAVAAQAFEFVTPLELWSVDPAQGPVQGGTPVVVRGRGFDEGTVVLFGGVPCVAPQVHGGEELTCITPGGPPGPIDVQVAASSGFVTAVDAFRYTAPPRVEKVWPPAGPATGGTNATLQGEALWDDATVRLAGNAAQVDEPGDGQRLGIVTPPGPVGPADLAVTTSDGTAVFPGAFTYLPGDDAFVVWNVFPGEGPLQGGGEAVVVVTGLQPDTQYAVTFGGQPAAIAWVNPDAHALGVQVPAGAAPGPVDVAVSGPDGAAVLPDGYVYWPALVVSGVVPDHGPVEGGTDVVISGKGFETGIPFVRFGPLPASLIEVVDDETLRARTPPGPAGPVDVSVRIGEHEAVAAGAFEYRPPGGVSLFALYPTHGAIAGGTYVELYGQGFEDGALVWFGKAQAKDVTVLSPTVVAVRTPPYPVATVDVTVVSAGQARTLHGAYTYFNPDSPKGGTWGPRIRGAVNVTVWDNAAEAPLEGAKVVLGAGPDAWVRTTDANGQTVFSAKNLHGPLQITASKQGYTAYTVSHFDAENVSIGLWPASPSSPNPGGGGGEGGPIPIVGGHVLGFGKYVQTPPRACEDLAGTPPGYCEPCVADAECQTKLGPSGSCVPVPQLGGKAPLRCTMGCSTDADCPAESVCAAWGDAARCLPAPLPRAGFCVSTKPSPFDDPPEWSLQHAISDDGAYAISTDTGELAIVCYGGVMLPDATFVPLVMGVRRHVFTAPGDVLDGQDVTLDIPMDRELVARIVHPPGHGEVDTYDYHVSLQLDGDDGFIVFRVPPTKLKDGTLRFWPLPRALTGPLSGARYAFFTRATGKGTVGGAIPSSINLLMDVETLDVASVWEPGPDGAWQGMAAAPSAPLSDVWGDGQGFMVAVGPNGTIVHRANGQWWPQPKLVAADLRAVWGASAQDVWAVGDGGVALHFDGTAWKATQTGVTFALRDVWGVGPSEVYAVGEGGLLRWDGAAWTLLQVPHSDGLRSVAGRSPTPIVAVGGDGKVLVRENDAWVAAFVAGDHPLTAAWVGDDGALAAVGPGGVVRVRPPGNDAWEARDLADGTDVLAVWGHAADDLWVAGAGGVLRHWDGAAWQDRSLGARAFDIAAMWGPGGTPSVLVGRAAFALGPFEDFPVWKEPSVQVPFEPGPASWQPPTPLPSFHTLAFVNANGNSLWKIVVDGAVHSVELPDLDALIDWTPLGDDGARLVVTHVLSAPSSPFSIDAFDAFDFSVYRRLSWSTLYVPFP